MRKKYGYAPSYHSAAGAAAGLILQLAIQDAGTLDTEAVREALLKFDHDIFWGPTAWDETGANISGASGVIQIQDGKVVSIYPEDIRAGSCRSTRCPAGLTAKGLYCSGLHVFD